MLTKESLEKLISQDENKNLELKKSTGEYSGQKKPLVRNGGNCNTDFKETILIVLFFAQFRMLGPRGILNLVRASHSQTSISKGGMYMRMRDAGLIQPKANHKM